MNQNEINMAFASMKDAEVDLAVAINNKVMAEIAFDIQTAALTAGGKLEGPNAETRKAELFRLTAEERKQVVITASNLVNAKRDHAIAKAEVDRVKYTIRYLEIAAHAASNG